MAYLADSLETLGYKWAYRVIDARAFGLPQRRRRVFLVASAEGDPRCVLLQDDAGAPSEDGTDGRSSHGFYWTEGNRGLGWAIDAVPPLKGGSGLGVPSPPAIWLREGGIVLPKIRDAERLQGLSPGWTKPAEHADTSSYRWKLVGNAVSVPAAKWLGRGLLQPSVAYTRGGKPFDDRGNWPPAAWNIGDGRFEAPVSAWPVRREMKPLHEFLREETVPLSERATEGFLGRLVASRLHVDPQFIRALRRHLRSFSNRKRPSKGIN